MEAALERGWGSWRAHGKRLGPASFSLSDGCHRPTQRETVHRPGITLRPVSLKGAALIRSHQRTAGPGSTGGPAGHSAPSPWNAASELLRAFKSRKWAQGPLNFGDGRCAFIPTQTCPFAGERGR